MGTDSKIEWTDTTWNPVVGCTKVSEGCQNCYAERMAGRQAAMECAKIKDFAQLTKRQRRYVDVVTMMHDPREEKTYFKGWNGKTFCDESALDKPLHWKNPRKIFVCSMGDLFHPSVPFAFIDRVMNVVWDCNEHIFQVLTKRPERMLAYFKTHNLGLDTIPFPLDNLWLGVTAENQAMADRRIPILLQIPAAVRFVSVEPMLGPVDFREFEEKQWRCDGCGELYSHFQDLTCNHCGYAERQADYVNPLDWVIIGCESGPNARYCKNENVRNLIEQCKAAGTPVFVKQVHSTPSYTKKSVFMPIKDITKFPKELQIREYPEVKL